MNRVKITKNVISRVINLQTNYPGITQHKIATIVGISRTSVGRIIRSYYNTNKTSKCNCGCGCNKKINTQSKLDKAILSFDLSSIKVLKLLGIKQETIDNKFMMAYGITPAQYTSMTDDEKSKIKPTEIYMSFIKSIKNIIF